MEFISIITAIHNGLSFNKIYWNSLQQFTHYPYELIIIDNGSTDGSGFFFRQRGVTVIRNEAKSSYPHCLNQGVRAASGDYLFFLNHDTVVSPRWDKNLIDASRLHQLDIVSACGIGNMGDPKITRAIERKWKLVKNPMKLLGFHEQNLKRMFFILYGNWEKFCDRIFDKNGMRVVEGIAGSNVLMTKKAMEKMGGWDETNQTLDCDLFKWAKKRSLEKGDVKPCQIAAGVFIHDYKGMKVKYAVKPQPVAGETNLLALAGTWSARDLDRLHPNHTLL
jgi:GT2 family glycosyltransferase